MITDYHAKNYSHELHRVGGSGVKRPGRVFFDQQMKNQTDEKTENQGWLFRKIEGCNLPNLKQEDENWKVRLVEEEFHKKMWEAE